jgi:L-ascorbate metabolism protein UlaG (beta-lactamase superfamily)
LIIKADKRALKKKIQLKMKNFNRQFGGKVTKELQRQYEKSENWKNGKFQNLIKTEMDISLAKIPALIYKQITKKGQKPKANLPIIPFDEKAFLAPSDKAKFIWYAHSVVLMRLKGKTILIDPMLGDDTTPIAPFPNKRFSEDSLSLIDSLPEIDLILLTHDHYDHLDFDSIQKLKHKCKKYFVAMGLKRHLVSWGVGADLVREFDWWNEGLFEGIQITFTPTRHFSGRGLTDRAKCLWGGWVFTTDEENIWFSGDSGYGEHFKEIGDRLGPFDFAFMECGQYNDDWRAIHMFPDESVQAALDAKVKKGMPVHWAGFSLSYQHTWEEPAEEFVKFAEEKSFDYLLPSIGQLFSYSDQLREEWWR